MSLLLQPNEPPDEFDNMAATFTNITFVDKEQSESFDCAICYEKIRNAIAVCEDHIFCEECINQLMFKSGPIFNCPTCRRKCDKSEIKRVKFIDRQIKSLLIKCPNHEITPVKSIYLKKLAIKNNSNNLNAPNTDTGNSHTRSRSRSNSPSRSRSRSRSRDRNDHDKNASNSAKKCEIEMPKSHMKFCDWQGKYEKLASHIRECKYELIRCNDCDKCMERGEINNHFENECEMYPIQCILCELYVPRSVLEHHKIKECKMAMVKCGSCNEEIKRINMDKHYNKCPNAIVSCNFYPFGCNVMNIKRKDLDKHLNDNVKIHLKLVCQSHGNLEEKCNGLEKKMKTLSEDTQKKIGNLENMICAGMIQKRYNNYNLE